MDEARRLPFPLKQDALWSAGAYPSEYTIARPDPLSYPQLAKLRAYTREELLAATEVNLQKIKARADTATLVGQDAIGLRVGKIVNQYKVAKHFQLDIGDHAFSFQRNHDSIAAETASDGIYIIRTSVPATQMDAPKAAWQIAFASGTIVG